MPVGDRFTRRAHEVAEDLLEELDKELRNEALAGLPVEFRLEGSQERLNRPAAEMWIKESVDEGHPAVRYHIERRGPEVIVVNLAAFEDPDSQFHP
jgi:hypothetical protein